MGPFLHLWAWCSVWLRPRDDRGDVPGWVLVTVMSVGIVGVIWAVAEDQLALMLRNALRSVQ
jgi:hypothetical protein